MPTVTKSIGTDSRDYSTVTLWEADLDSDVIYDAGDDVVGECYNDSPFDESPLINGGITLGLNTITLTVAAGERHDGTAGTGARFVVTGNKQINTDGGADTTYQVEVSWLEMDWNGNAPPGANDGIISFRAISGHVGPFRATNLLVHGGLSSSGLRGITCGTNKASMVVLNTIVYDIETTNTGAVVSSGLYFDVGSAESTKVHNCTVHNIAMAGTSKGRGIFQDSTNAASANSNCIVNNITNSGSGGADDYSVTSGDQSYNMSEDETAAGTGSLTGKTAANQFVSTVEGSEDLHLKAGAEAIDVGIDLGTSPSGVQTDINGRDRDAQGDTWDIGAHEYVAAAVGGVTARSRISLGLGMSG